MATVTIAKSGTSFNLQDLTEAVREESKNNFDATYRARNCSFEYGSLLTPDGKFPLTDDGASRLSERMGMPRTVYAWLAKYDREEWQKIVSTQWRNWALAEDKNILARLRHVPVKPEDGGTTRQVMVRSVLSENYGIFDNVEFLQMFADSLPAEMRNAQFHGMKNTACVDPVTGSLKAKLLIPTGFDGSEKDPHSLGMQFGNNEVGAGTANFAAILGRWFCTNQLTLGAVDCRLTHQGQRQTTAPALIQAAIDKVVGRSGEAFQAYWNTRDIKMVDPAEAIRNLQPLMGLGKTLLNRIVDEKLASNVAELGSNGYAVINAITEMARDTEDIEKATAMEHAAGKLAIAERRFWMPFQN
jgi:hypothetical protein